MAMPEEDVDKAAHDCTRDQTLTPNRVIKVEVNVYEATPRVVHYLRGPDVDVHETTSRVVHYVRGPEVEVVASLPKPRAASRFKARLKKEEGTS